MKRILITGVNGFVGRHMLAFLAEQGEPLEVLGIDVEAGTDFTSPMIAYRTETVQLLDRERLAEIVRSFAPHYLLHLAAFSSVAMSWREPRESFLNNTNIFLNVLEAVRGAGLSSRILSVGSSEEYGNNDPAMMPLNETMSLQPINPYAVARVSQEMLSRVYGDGYGLDIIMTRSFNHIGPGQRDIFVVSSFIKQLVTISRTGGCGVIRAGDVSIIRDFLDVRDVVRAYWLLLMRGERGEIYNVCSGRGIALRHIIETAAGMLKVSVTVETDVALLRPSDNQVIIGSHAKLSAATGWEPSIPLERSLADIIRYWEERA